MIQALLFMFEGVKVIVQGLLQERLVVILEVL
jgi:hypothetical protein